MPKHVMSDMRWYLAQMYNSREVTSGRTVLIHAIASAQQRAQVH